MSIESQMTVNGEHLTAPSSFAVENPATGEYFAEAPACDNETLNHAVDAAHATFPDWAHRNDRAALLLECSKQLRSQTMKLAPLLTAEQGKPLRESINELMGASLTLRHYGEMEALHEPDSTHRSKFKLTRHPIGVVAAITPWNYPVMLAMSKIAPALFAGNTVVAKPSPYTPLTTLAIGELFKDILPPGVLNTVSGDDELGKEMTSHPLVKMITLTGSVETGKAVARSAANDLKRIVLELGGNDAAIVLSDVDPKQVANDLLWGAFRNCGQICHAIKRLFIHDSIANELIAELKQLVECLSVGDGSDRTIELGPLNNRPQLERVKSLVDHAKNNGARMVTGGNPISGSGYFFEPTLVDDIQEGVALVDEEQFGPALPILRFNDLDEAITRTNDSNFGLGASIWSKDEQRATELGKHLECGSFWVNQHGTTHPGAPVGGQKWSGLGYENGQIGLNEYSRFQTVFSQS